MFINFSILALLFELSIKGVTSDKECIRKYNGLHKIVCVCNATYCDTVSPVKPLPPTQYLTYTTNEAGLRFKKEMNYFKSKVQNHTNAVTIAIDSTKTYQKIYGFGGAFSDGSIININALEPGAQENFLKSYFSEEGIEYNFGHVPMGASDFSMHPYTYDDGPKDPALRHFRLKPEDYEGKIPMIKRAQSLAKDELLLFATAWMAPVWMIRSKEKRYLKSSMYQTWADYHLKFLKAYKKEGLNFWGITTGNEPIFQSLVFKGHTQYLCWLPQNMTTWVAYNLGPALRNSEFSNIKLITFNELRSFFPWFVDTMFSLNKTENYIDGLATHWYGDFDFSPILVDYVRDKYQNKFIFSSEASQPSVSTGVSVTNGSWPYARNYANDIAQNMNHWSTGWVDFNLAVDTKGGPAYLEDYSDGAVVVNASVGEFYKQPMFYAIGQFSKFIPRGSVKISQTLSSDKLNCTAFRRPDGGTVVVIVNGRPDNSSYIVHDKRNGYIENISSANSITTIVYW